MSLRRVKQQGRGRQREGQKTNRLRLPRQLTLHVHHAFFAHLFTVAARLQREST